MFALILLVFTVYATIGYVLIRGVSLFQILTAALVICFGVHLLRGGPVDRRVVVRLVIPFLLFLSLCILSTAQAVNLTSSWNYIRNWIGSLLLAFVVAHVLRKPRHLERLMICIFVVTILGATLAILQRYVSAGISLVPYLSESSDPFAAYFVRGSLLARPAGFGKMNFELGKDMLLGVLPAFALLVVGRTLIGPAATTLTVGTVAIVISGLRSTWLAAVAGILTILALWLVRSAVHRRTVVWVPVILAMSILLVSASLLAAIRASADRPYSTNLRVALIHASVGMLQDSPSLGVGIGNFKHRYAEYYPETLRVSEIDPRRNVPAHNVLLEVLVGAGPAALIAYLLVQLGAIANCAEAVRLARARPDGRVLHAAAAGVGATLIALFVEYLTHNLMFENHLWLMVGVSFAIRRMAASSEPIGAPALDRAMPSATV